LATDAVSHPQRSDRSLENALKPVALHQRLTET
jgi:hypothetical protein